MAILEWDSNPTIDRLQTDFKPELRDAAADLAQSICSIVGPKAELLRPETTIDEIFKWSEIGKHTRGDSLDKVELLMLVEEHLGISVQDNPSCSDRGTFLDLVELIAEKRRGR